MKIQKYLLFAIALSLAACNTESGSKADSHEGHDHAKVAPKTDQEVHSHDAHNHADEGHTHTQSNSKFDKSHQEHDLELHKNHDSHTEAPKLQLMGYSDYYEVYIEADPFTKGEDAKLVVHISSIPGFKPVGSSAKIKISLIIDDYEVTKELKRTKKKGVYSLKITPKVNGNGRIVCSIREGMELHKVEIANVKVFSCAFASCAEAQNQAPSMANTSAFTKEQSWKINFSTELPTIMPFGQVIKTTAQIQSAQGDEVLVSAKINGIVILSDDNIVEGKSVNSGHTLFTISGKGLANNNASVQFANAKSDYEKAKSDYERVKELAKDKIVSDKELLNAKNTYDIAKTNYDNLKSNFNASGQKIKSSMTGYVKQLYVQNGEYVEAGQPIVSISQNKTLLLKAEVQQKYAPILSTILDANIRTIHNNKTYTLAELNGKVISYARNTNSDNYLIPISLQIDNVGSFVPGSFIEVYLKSITNNKALTIDNGALMEDQGHYFIFVQITPELFEKREVHVGGTDGLRTEITKGLSENERVVTKGAVLIKLAQASGALDPHSGHVH